jgi:nucleoside-diphosphate-sugar epimerase
VAYVLDLRRADLRHTQFLAIGEHPLLSITKEHLITQGFLYCGDFASLDMEAPVFLVIGAEVYSQAESLELLRHVSNILPVVQNWPILLLSSSSVYADKDHKLESLPQFPMEETQGHLISSTLDIGAIRPLTALMIENLVLQRPGRTLVVRPFNVWGPSLPNSIVMTMINQAKEGCVYVPAPGTQVRTFLYEDDYLDGITLLVSKLLAGNRGIFNLGSEEPIEYKFLAKSVVQIFNAGASILPQDWSKRGAWWKIPSIERIKQAGWKPSSSLRSSLFRLSQAS